MEQAAVDDLAEVRAWLLDNKGRWVRLSRAMELSSKTLSRIANGEVSDISLSTYRKLERAMNSH
ncbi:hypothetical protein R6138_04346 [Ralstonia thomasii]|jgi:DNA-binding Xre family transcriptional regulator|uniref:hypothetical protein n=1 Tax=Ralstonia thomasii TaxID=3058596 RepID=UPI0028F6A1F5|nr:hypothetical protein [Ralstonia sp. LMG 18095]CAJ0899546.1 hypothetical protein R6138_04346 [Ralstonia sp. LMG 18095]